MILVLAGLIFGFLGALLFRHLIKNGEAKFTTLKGIIAAIICFIAAMLVTFGFSGARIDEGEYLLITTNNVVIQNCEDGMYEVLDEENNIVYYFNSVEVEVLKDGKRGAYGNKIIYDCKILKGDYDQPYIGEYEVDYKMNWWSFELVNRPEYILYIPESMVNE